MLFIRSSYDHSRVASVSQYLRRMDASVHVYEAMYTPQLVQKRKKWYDGICKFFHANKKLVLIDLDTNHRVAETFMVGDSTLPEQGTRVRVGNFLVDVGELSEIKTKQKPLPIPPSSSPLKKARPSRDDGPSFDDILSGYQPFSFFSSAKRQKPDETDPGSDPGSDPELDSPANVSDDECLLLSSDPELEPTIVGVNELPQPRKSPFENMPADAPHEGPWTKEAYLLFSFRPPVIKSELPQ